MKWNIIFVTIKLNIRLHILGGIIKVKPYHTAKAAHYNHFILTYDWYGIFADEGAQCPHKKKKTQFLLIIYVSKRSAAGDPALTY